MRSTGEVITDVVNGHGPRLAELLEVSERRCYEILSKDNPVPKAKRLIRAIAQINPEGCRLIRADFDAFFDDILGDDDDEPVSDAELNNENADVIRVVLEHQPIDIQKKELREAIATDAKKLRQLEKLEGEGYAYTPKPYNEVRTKAVAVTLNKFGPKANGNGKTVRGRE